MAFKSTGKESSAGTYEGRMLAIEQTMILIINLGHTTTLAEATRPREASHPASLNTQEMTA
jgi:hypothetical protein